MSTKKRVIIIGAGLSCQVFLSLVNNENLDITIIEKNSKSFFESEIDDVPFYFNKIIPELNLNFKKCVVNMGIYDNGFLYKSGNSRLSDKYSMKILGRKCGNTIKLLEEHKNIFLISNENIIGRKMLLSKILLKRNKKHKFLFKKEIVDINLNDKCVTLNSKEKVYYDYLISTIPLNLLINISSYDCPYELVNSPFYIYTVSNVDNIEYRVAYCTDSKIRFNRIARLGSDLYIESPVNVELNDLNKCENEFLATFINLNTNKYLVKKNKVIPGRFEQLNLKEYNEISNFYFDNNVFLLGRLATWRFKLIEDVVEDAKKIIKEISKYD